MEGLINLVVGLKMNLVHNLFITAVATCLSFSVFNTNFVQAVTVRRTFTVNDFSRPGIGIIDNLLLSPGNSYNGVFTYNDELLTSPNVKDIPILNLNFNFLGTTYTERDDVGYPQFPKVNIQNGTFESLNFVINKPQLAANFNPNGFIFGLPPSAIAGRNQGGYSIVDQSGLYVGRVSYSSATVVSVFEPSNVAGIACLFFGRWFLSRNKVKMCL